MLYQNIKLHNVAEVEETNLGLRMYRFPLNVCRKMGIMDKMHGREVALHTSG
jgi:hypothetical protein